MGCIKSLLTLMFLSTIALSVNSQENSNQVEYSIKFKDEASIAQKNELHEKFKSIVTYRSIHLNIDAISVDFSLRNICSNYKNSPIVLDCRISHKAIKHNEVYNPCNYNTKKFDTIDTLKNDLKRTTDCINVDIDFGENLDNELSKKLSPMWAHNLIGVDLTREVMELNKDQTVDTKVAFYEAIHLNSLPDSSIDSELKKCKFNTFIEECKGKKIGEWHGTNVSNLVLGEPPIGIGAKAKVSVTKDDNSGDQAGTHLKIMDQMIKTKTKILSHSLGIGNLDKTESEIFDEMYKRNMIVVQSAGNSYPDPVYGKVDQPSPDKTIIVGSLSPSGFTSDFSSESPSVTILAPADDFIPSRFKGKYERFSGTSAAQPVVAGAISNVTSILPDITPDEVKKLLISTAIPTANINDKPKLNGSGTVNAYKLVKVAMRLKAQWPSNRGDIFKNPTLYNFNEEVSQINENILKLKKSKNECDRKRYLKSLRQSFLLNSEDKKIIKLLSEFLTSSSHPDDAIFYNTLLEGDNGQYLKHLFDKSKTKQETTFSGSALRRAMLTKDSNLNYMILESLKTNDKTLIELASIAGIDGKYKKDIEDVLLKKFKSKNLTDQDLSQEDALYFAFETLKGKISTKPFLLHCFSNNYNGMLNPCIGQAFMELPEREFIKLIEDAFKVKQGLNLVKLKESVLSYGWNEEAKNTRKAILTNLQNSKFWSSEEKKAIADILEKS